MGLSGLSLFYSIVKMVPIQISFRETMVQWRTFETKRIMSIIVGLCTVIIMPSLMTLFAFRVFGKSNYILESFRDLLIKKS